MPEESRGRVYQIAIVQMSSTRALVYGATEAAIFLTERTASLGRSLLFLVTQMGETETQLLIVIYILIPDSFSLKETSYQLAVSY